MAFTWSSTSSCKNKWRNFDNRTARGSSKFVHYTFLTSFHIHVIDILWNNPVYDRHQSFCNDWLVISFQFPWTIFNEKNIIQRSWDQFITSKLAFSTHNQWMPVRCKFEPYPRLSVDSVILYESRLTTCWLCMSSSSSWCCWSTLVIRLSSWSLSSVANLEPRLSLICNMNNNNMRRTE